MKKLRILALVASSTLVSSAGLLVACGDDTVVSVDVDGGGADAQTDAARPDAAVSDGGADAATKPDADAGPTLASYPNLVAEGICSSLTRCCFGSANVADGGAVDGGAADSQGRYDKSACLGLYKDLGFEFSNLGVEAFANNTVTLDQGKAQDCLAKVAALSCDLTGPELEAARASCFDAVVGKQAAGQPCRSSMECGKGLFCNPPSNPAITDGGVVGVCEALRTDGQSCDIVQSGDDFNDTVLGEEACSWRASGDTNLHCESYYPDPNGVSPYALTADGYYADRQYWLCRPAVPVDQYCNSTVSCDKGICDFGDFLCKSPLPYFAGLCKEVVKP